MKEMKENVSVEAGVPNQATQQVSGGQASEASSATPHHSHYHLNHPSTTPSVEKLSSTKPAPGAKKVGGAAEWRDTACSLSRRLYIIKKSVLPQFINNSLQL